MYMYIYIYIYYTTKELKATYVRALQNVDPGLCEVEDTCFCGTRVCDFPENEDNNDNNNNNNSNNDSNTNTNTTTTNNNNDDDDNNNNRTPRTRRSSTRSCLPGRASHYMILCYVTL